jgi:RHS repeat-associated protein
MQMPGRKYNVGTGEYRFGFNGKEKDNSTGEGNLDFGARIMDVRLGRWLSIDPEYRKYPNQSAYSSTLNNPIKWIDLGGKVVKDPNGNVIFTVTNPNAEYIQSQSVINGKLYTYYFKAIQGKILTDNGTEVIAYKAISNDVYERVQNQFAGVAGPRVRPDAIFPQTFDCEKNCTGNALTNKILTISSAEITSQYLNDEGLQKINSANAKTGDVGMYKDNTGLVHHLELFTSSTEVSTKGGIEIDPGPSIPGQNSNFKVGTIKPGGRVITDYSIYTKTQPDKTVVPSSFIGPISPNQVSMGNTVSQNMVGPLNSNQTTASQIVPSSTSNGLNTVTNDQFNNIKERIKSGNK